MEDFENLFRFIEEQCGIRVNDSHRTFVQKYVNKRMGELYPQVSSVGDFLNLVKSNPKEKHLLLDEAAINETYFFREESHFDFLKNEIFPKLKKNQNGSKINIWSAACSTGEEAVSLYALSEDCQLNAKIYASDIDTAAMEVLKKGQYTNHSFRVDGHKFMPLLEKIGSKNDSGIFQIDKKHLDNINLWQFNLISDQVRTLKDVDIIFLRNAFIYFSAENQKLVLRKMCDALKLGGILILSVNEIASVNSCDDIPLVKKHCGTVNYLEKVTQEEFENLKRPRLSLRNFPCLPQKQKTVAFIAPKPNQLIGDVKRIAGKISESKLFNPDYKFKTAEKIETLASSFFVELNKRNFYGAKKIIDSHKFKTSELEYFFYMNALIFQMQEKNSEAEIEFSKAVIANPKFWPAHFQLGMIYKKIGNQKKKIEEFKKCSELLKIYVKNEKMQYNFIVESFDISYFIDMCEKESG